MLQTTINAPSPQTPARASRLSWCVGQHGEGSASRKAASGGLAVAAFDTPILFSLGPVLLAFGCAFGTGLIFGYMPAHKAATFDPVVALGAE